jgi:hypothetical protein
VHRVVQGLRQTLEPRGGFGHGPDGFVDDARRRGDGTDDRAEPPQVGQAPGGLPRLTASVVQENGVAPTLRGLELVDGVFTCPAPVATGFRVNRGDGDGWAVTCAPQAGPWDGVSPVGCDPIPGLLGDHGGRDDPAALAFGGAIAGAPSATRAGCIAKDEVRALGWQPTDAVIEVTRSRPDSAEGDDLGAVVLNDRGDGKRVFMDIQTDVECARLVHG